MKFFIVLSLLAFASAAVIRMDLHRKRNPLARQNPLRANRIFNPKMKGTANGEISEYLTTNITIGTPPQTFRLSVVTETAELIVYDSSCTTCKDWIGTPANKFDSSKSSTYVKDGRAIKNATNIKGFLGLDTMRLGGIGEQQITIKGQIIGQITESSFPVVNIDDGSLGLGLPAAASEGFVPPLFNAINQGLLDEPIYTIWIEKLRQPGVPAGQLTYGGLDTDHCRDVIAYHPLSTATNWQLRMKSISAGGYSSSVGWETQIHSFYAALQGPKSIVDAIYVALGAKWSQIHNQYTVDCDVKLEPIVLGFGSYKYPFILPIVDIMTTTNEVCLIELYGMDFGGYTPMWSIGKVFGRHYCEIFDVGQQRIGFAPVLEK